MAKVYTFKPKKKRRRLVIGEDEKHGIVGKIKPPPEPVFCECCGQECRSEQARKNIRALEVALEEARRVIEENNL